MNILEWCRLERERASITMNLDTRELDKYADDREIYMQKLQARESIRDCITIVIVLLIAGYPVAKMLYSLID